MSLDDLLNEMNEKMKTRDLSDDYLREHNNSTREEIGIGEYAYGITMIPCKWVYEYLSDYKRVLKENEILKEEKEQAWEEWNSLEQGSYETELKLKEENRKLKAEMKDGVIAIKLYALQTENEKLKNKLLDTLEGQKVIKEETPQYIKENFIPVEKVKNKIEHYQKLQHNYIEKYDEINEGLQAMISALQELLGKE